MIIFYRKIDTLRVFPTKHSTQVFLTVPPRAGPTLGHWKQKHPGAAGFTSVGQKLQLDAMVWECHSMVRERDVLGSVCRKTKLLCCYATGTLVLLVLVCLQRQIKNNRDGMRQIITVF